MSGGRAVMNGQLQFSLQSWAGRLRCVTEVLLSEMDIPQQDDCPAAGRKALTFYAQQR